MSGGGGIGESLLSLTSVVSLSAAGEAAEEEEEEREEEEEGPTELGKVYFNISFSIDYICIYTCD